MYPRLSKSDYNHHEELKAFGKNKESFERKLAEFTQSKKEVDEQIKTYKKEIEQAEKYRSFTKKKTRLEFGIKAITLLRQHNAEVEIKQQLDDRKDLFKKAEKKLKEFKQIAGEEESKSSLNKKKRAFETRQEKLETKIDKHRIEITEHQKALSKCLNNFNKKLLQEQDRENAIKEADAKIQEYQSILPPACESIISNLSPISDLEKTKMDSYDDVSEKATYLTDARYRSVNAKKNKLANKIEACESEIKNFKGNCRDNRLNFTRLVTQVQIDLHYICDGTQIRQSPLNPKEIIWFEK